MVIRKGLTGNFRLSGRVTRTLPGKDYQKKVTRKGFPGKSYVTKNNSFVFSECGGICHGLLS
jgi:hypothetical protein